MFGEVADDALELCTGGGGVEVHAEGGDAFEQVGYLFFHFFRSCADVGELVFLAGGAAFGDTGCVTAVVTGEGGGFLVECQSDVTMGTSGHPSTGFAFNEGGEAATVLEQDDLFLAFEGCSHHFDESGGKHTLHLAFALGFLRVDNFDGGQLHVTVTLGELDVTVLSLV